MKFQKPLWVVVPCFLLIVFACVTINIYFPAEKVESVAGEIVDEIRGQNGEAEEQAPGDQKDSVHGGRCHHGSILADDSAMVVVRAAAGDGQSGRVGSTLDDQVGLLGNRFIDRLLERPRRKRIKLDHQYWPTITNLVAADFQICHAILG